MIQWLEEIKVTLENIMNEEKLNLYLQKLFEILNKYKNELIINSFKKNDVLYKTVNNKKVLKKKLI